ncbi:YiiX/YebB-like N1pC/P60 family cysteine hydrolase [Bdellovibrio sp. HCB337]|uniref:YiiX/YebB-like N1pC/P60 family cysteine hydrolase n=1 Tax=Bdellovibrio sp. HCB337 TaxID=3394358 RepID=UPI0039A56723
MKALLVFLVQISWAQVQVAFLEGPSQIGRFSHVAISYKGQWLHTHPYRGVELVSTVALGHMGVLTEVMVLNDRSEPSEKFVNEVLGKPYDHGYSWDSDGYYCSKLVGIILGLQPKPMTFDASIWPPSFQKLKGRPGISPDDVYLQLTKQGYRTRSFRPLCSKLFVF